MLGLSVSLFTEAFFGGIGGADLDFGRVMSSNWIKGVVVFGGESVPVDRSGTPFLGGGIGRGLAEAVGEGGGCHEWGAVPIGPVPVELTFGLSTSTTQSCKSSKLDFRPRLGGDREGECKSLPLSEYTLFNGLGFGDGAMVERALAVGEIGSSRMLVASSGVLTPLTSSPKSLVIVDFDWWGFWSLRASKADILDWMEVEGDMINLCKQAQACPPQPKNCTPSQVFHVDRPFSNNCSYRAKTFVSSQ
jgi:hypothetical protein